MRFTSSRHLQLVVHDLSVTFVDGEPETTDKIIIEALRRLPTELGVRAAGGRPPNAATVKTGKDPA